MTCFRWEFPISWNMADAESFESYSASPSFVKCVKCLNDAVHPVVISCYHTICRECYDVIVNESEECIFKCPFCGSIGGAGIPPPPSNAFVDIFRETFAAFVRYCSICEKKGLVMTAVEVCLDCPWDRFLCQTCSEQHSSFPILSSHSLTPVEDYVEGTERKKNTEEMCSVHPAKVVDVVCSACEARMCLLCSMTKPCPKAVSPFTAHTIVDKEDMNAALKRDIGIVCEECSVNVAEVDRLMEAAQDEVLTATADAEMALEKLDVHKAAVREEWDRTEKHMDEMRSQLKASHQARMGELKGMVKKLEYVRQVNERGKVLAERAVCRAPKEDLGNLLTEVHKYRMSAPVVDPPPSSVLVFIGPDLVEIQKKMESVGGSLIDQFVYTPAPGPPVINHRVFIGPQPWDCHRMGSLLIEAYLSNRQLCVVDEEGVRRVIHSGDSYIGTCSTSDGDQLFAVSFSSQHFYTFSSDSSGSFQLINKTKLSDCSSIWGVSTNNSGLCAVTDNTKSCVRVSDAKGQLVKSVGPSVGRVEALGHPYKSVWSTDEKYLYVTNSGGGSGSVVCINMITDSVQWKTPVSDPFNINLVRGELYVTQCSGSNVTVLDPKDGSILRTHECPGRARGVYADGPSKVSVVSYKN